jgi:putative heme-binding domain-containing protein
MRYYAAAYPKEYQGNLFCCNWGRHGFAGANRGIFRFVLDERNNVVKKETLVACTDPHFRPSHICLDVDGSLLIADWYGRDDESDMTGRIWRLKYVGKDRPVVKHKLDSAEWKNDDYLIEALGSPDHLVRAKALDALAKSANIDVIRKLCDRADIGTSLGAANALWALLRIDTDESRRYFYGGVEHADWRVRRLAFQLMRQHASIPEAVIMTLDTQKDPAVLVQAALSRRFPGETRTDLIRALTKGAAKDPHLRYEAAWHLARSADEGAVAQLLTAHLTKLLASDDAEVRLAGLIAIDIACYENFPNKKFALEALAKALENPGKLDQQLLLMVAHLDGDASIVPGLEKLIARDDVPLSTTAKAIIVLKAKAGGLSKGLSAAAGKRLIEAVDKGAVKIATPADQLMLFEFLESEGPTPFALKQVGGQLRSSQPAVRQAAHVLARKFGNASAPLAEPLWPVILSPDSKFEDAIDMLATVARIEKQPRKQSWEKLLENPDPLVRAESVRWWRNFRGNEDMVDVLVRRAPELLKQDGNLGDDLSSVLSQLGKTDQVKALKLPAAQHDKETLTKYALAELAVMPAAEKPKRAAMGLQVFERSACTKCHTTATQTTLLAPSLKGIAGQKVDYLIESVLYPSKIIKTGFESETIVRMNGKIVTGLVKEDGDFLRVLNQDFEVRIPKSDVDSRTVSRVSIMPEGQEQMMSRREFVDLIAYLATLK